MNDKNKNGYRDLVQKCLDFVNKDTREIRKELHFNEIETFRLSILKALMNSPSGDDIERDAETNKLILDD